MNNPATPPQDMWPEETKSASAAPVSPAPKSAPVKPSQPRSKWVTWVVTIAVLVVVALGGGYAFGRYWPTIQSWFNKEQPVEQTGPVAWQPIQPIQSLGLMNEGAQESRTPGYSSSTNTEELARYYKVGEFVEGPYKDSELVLAQLSIGGMGPQRGVFRFVKKTDGSLVLLGRQSPDLSDWAGSEDLMINTAKFTTDSAYLIPDLEMPEKITNPDNSRQVIYAAGNGGGMFSVGQVSIIKNSYWKKPERWVEVFKNPINQLPIYTDPKPTNMDQVGDSSHANGFYVVLPDGTFLDYAMRPNFMNAGSTGFSGEGVVGVMFNDSGKEVWNDDEYSMATIGGCGTVNFAAVVPDRIDSKTSPIGKTGAYGSGDNQQDIYGFKDQNEPELKELYDTYTAWNQTVGGKAMTYKQFLATHPVFFWKDPFSRIIKFTRKDILPAAECGKPVIYLYPEKTTRVSVKVNPIGGFSFTDPEYGTGWEVVAKPSGELTEIKSGKVYPYLFWEGRGGLYQAPTKGWVIKQSEVSSLLDSKLAELGLNSQETADFKEFWLPRMQEAPYYQIGFWDKGVMNMIAPLSITPKPDTVIRILMDFKPLPQPINITAPTIKTPARNGFTVVEWGGVIQ